MRGFVLVLICWLAACSDRVGHFAGVPATLVEVGGSRFEVRLRGTLAEATRVNPQYAPRLGPLRQQAATAMARVSGCEVRGVLGDQAVMTGILLC